MSDSNFASFDLTLPFAVPMHDPRFDPGYQYLPKYQISPHGSPIMAHPYGGPYGVPRQYMAQTDEDWNPVALGINSSYIQIPILTTLNSSLFFR